MHQAADSIFNKVKLGSHIGKVYLSETDAEVIPTEGYETINVTQAGAAETRGLANGAEGQRLLIICTAFAANVVITPSAIVGSTITFDADEEYWEGVFLAGEWHTIRTNATVA